MKSIGEIQSKEFDAQDFITTKEAAKLLRRSEWWLKNLRMVGGGPPYYKIGRGVLYRQSELIGWVQLLRVRG